MASVMCSGLLNVCRMHPGLPRPPHSDDQPDEEPRHVGADSCSAQGGRVHGGQVVSYTPVWSPSRLYIHGDYSPSINGNWSIVTLIIYGCKAKISLVNLLLLSYTHVFKIKLF